MEKLPFVKMRVGWDFKVCTYCNGTGKVKNGLSTKLCCNPLCCLGLALTARGYNKMKTLLEGVENENI